jgi:hypothetical protein
MSLGPLNFFLIILFFSFQLSSEPLQMKYANFKLLNKISNNINKKTIEVNSIVSMGTLNINVYSCFTEPPDEIPEDYVLIDVEDNFKNADNLIYRGWMISSSPDVTPLEHPIYDLWLLGCSNDKTF